MINFIKLVNRPFNGICQAWRDYKVGRALRQEGEKHAMLAVKRMFLVRTKLQCRYNGPLSHLPTKKDKVHARPAQRCLPMKVGSSMDSQGN